jgi:hypothetical protein
MLTCGFVLPVARRLAPPLLGLGVLALAGCSGQELSRDFGFLRDPPDEFAVTTRAPLSMPPDFNLRPPVPGEPRPQETSTRVQAEEALSPQIALTGIPAQNSPGQQALVQEAGPAAPAGIRAEVNRAAEVQAAQNDSFVNTLMFWRQPTPPGVVVDPAKEAQRIRENAALGRSQEIGQTPIIQPRQKAWLEGLF